jgi:hypothetical protein
VVCGGGKHAGSHCNNPGRGENHVETNGVYKSITDRKPRYRNDFQTLKNQAGARLKTTPNGGDHREVRKGKNSPQVKSVVSEQGKLVIKKGYKKFKSIDIEIRLINK